MFNLNHKTCKTMQKLREKCTAASQPFRRREAASWRASQNNQKVLNVLIVL
jgi:hypothetical protein